MVINASPFNPCAEIKCVWFMKYPDWSMKNAEKFLFLSLTCNAGKSLAASGVDPEILK